MNVFNEIRDKVIALFDKNGWIKWIHKNTMPAYTYQAKEQNVEYAKHSNHCATCLNLNGCCFPKNNMPLYPHHYGCHCYLEPAVNLSFKADSVIEKFKDYIFDPQKNKGKKVLFESWGYGIMDSEWLREEFSRQAQQKYANGDFALGLLDDYGQRINITITLPIKSKAGTVTFKSGWMVYPDGQILLATPYGGTVK